MTRLAVIGGGPGGEAAAVAAARAGAQVTLFEASELGGTCLNRGCVPSKVLLEGVHRYVRVRSSPHYIDGTEGLRPRWPDLQKRCGEVVGHFRQSLERHLKQLGVICRQGHARLKGPGSLTLDGSSEVLFFDKIILALGSRPWVPPPLDLHRTALWDTDGALGTPAIPSSLTVVGGGAVGCEMACLFHGLGARVSLVEKTGTLLPGDDVGVVRVLQNSFQSRGITLHLSQTVEKVESVSGQWGLTLSSGDRVTSEKVLVSVGRRPMLEGCGLEESGVRVERGRVWVDEHLETSVPGVFAVGDVNGLSLLAHAASVQGEVAAANALGGSILYDGDFVPRALYTWPEVASVGWFQSTGEARGVKLKARRFFFKGSPRAWADEDTEGFLQVLSEEATDRLRGVQIIGPHATELIHVAAVALKAGMTGEALRSVIFAHPTLAESFRGALLR